jgi:hypothetical protein
MLQAILREGAESGGMGGAWLEQRRKGRFKQPVQKHSWLSLDAVGIEHNRQHLLAVFRLAGDQIPVCVDDRGVRIVFRVLGLAGAIGDNGRIQRSLVENLGVLVDERVTDGIASGTGVYCAPENRLRFRTSALPCWEPGFTAVFP